MKEFEVHEDILMVGPMPFVKMVEIGHNLWVHPEYPRACILTSIGFRPMGMNSGKNRQHCIDLHVRDESDKIELDRIFKEIKDDRL